MIRKLTCSVLMLWMLTIVNGDTPTNVDSHLDEWNDIFPDVDSFSSRLERFSLEILKQTFFKQTDNFIMSPVSIWNAMSLLSEGANGNTLKEIKEVLRHPLDRKSITNDYQTVRTVLTGSSGVNLTSENAVFVSNQLNVSDEFKHVAKKDFVTKYFAVDLHNPKTADVINAIISNSTGGKITKFISKDEIVDAQMLLTNVINFKGIWTIPFNTSLTETEDFYDESDKPIGKLNYMYEEGPFPTAYIRKLQATAIELPYGDERFSMIVLLPRGGNTLTNVIKNLTYINMEDVYDRLQIYETTTELYLPRFKISSDLKLKEVLMSMGIKDVFDAEEADLSRITNNKGLFASSVFQKAGIEVNEEGTEAYAATGVLVVDRIASSPVWVNKPFVFFVVERKTRIILFHGAYTKPELY